MTEGNFDPDNQRFLERLQKGEKLYAEGDNGQILHCLHYCLFMRQPIPIWLLRAFNKAYEAVTASEFKSWDDVFGKPLPKGKQLKTERRNKEIVFELVYRVRELHDAGEPISKQLFEDVGAEFKISGTTASDLYYSFLEQNPEDSGKN